MNNIELKTKKYFYFWKSKNIKELSKLFDNGVILQDWENVVNGKEDLIKFNTQFFNSVDNIELDVVNIYNYSNITFSELIIRVNNNIIKVLDKIEYNKKGLITKITAYKG
ncbi:MAG: hypothetical protein CMC79_02860 [Flavobacteriaceae bacterium]|nr:hypothetical protein [Flavobacteriaceae bacterium]